MADVLQRLRDRAKIQNATGGYPLDKPNLSSEAADEIERLQSAMTLAAGRLTWCAGIIPNDDARDLAGTFASEAHDVIIDKEGSQDG